MNTNKPGLSVVIPVTERVDDPKLLFGEYRKALDALDMSYEMIFVIDGEFQDFRQGVEALAAEHSNLSIIQLGKAFGESTALSAGFDRARAAMILTLPAYLQCEPQELGKLFDKIESADMVLARRWPRVDSAALQSRTRLFNRLVALMTAETFDDLGCGVRLIRRAVVDDVPIYGDQHRFMPILAARRGFRVEQVDLTQSRHDSVRKKPPLGAYPRRLLDLLTVFFLVKFTKKPLRFFGLLGTATMAVGLIGLLVVVLQRVLFELPLADRPALLLSSLLVVLGVQLLAIGLVGEIVIFTHAKDMKEYTIKEIVGNHSTVAD